MKSIKQMIDRIHGMADTVDLSEWENKFIKSIWQQTADGTVTATVSQKQIEIIERIYDKHFAG